MQSLSWPRPAVGLPRAKALITTLVVMIALCIGVLVGRGNTFAFAAIAAAVVGPLMFLCLRRFPVLVIAAVIAASIFADNFAGSPIALRSLVGIRVALGDLLIAAIMTSTLVWGGLTHQIRLPRAVLWWLVWLVMLSQAMSGTTDPNRAHIYFLQIGLVPPMLAVTFRNLTWTRASREGLVQAVVVVASIVAGMAVFEQATGHYLFASNRRLNYLQTVNFFNIGNAQRTGGVFGQPDWFGGFLVLFIATALGLAAASGRGMRRLGWFGCAVILFGALLASGARLALLGSLISIGLFAWAGRRIRGQGRRQLGKVVLGGAILIGGFFVLAPHVSGLSRLNVASTRLSPTEDETNLRLGGAITGVRIAVAHPLRGIGLDYQRYVVLSVSPLYRDMRQYRPLAHPHNAYIELAAFAGFPVLIALVGILWSLLSALHRVPQNTEADPIRLGVFAALVGFLVSNLFVNLITMPGISYCFWALLLSQCEPVIQIPALTERGRAMVEGSGESGQRS